MDDDASLPCKDKIAFDSKKDALGAKALAKHRYGNSLVVYKCKYCLLWHLATNYNL